MEVDGYSHLMIALINFMAAAAVSKTATLTRPVESFESMATTGEHKKAKEIEAPFLKALDDHQGIIVKICRVYTNTRADEEDLSRRLFTSCGKPGRRFRGTNKQMDTVALRSTTHLHPFVARAIVDSGDCHWVNQVLQLSYFQKVVNI